VLIKTHLGVRNVSRTSIIIKVTITDIWKVTYKIKPYIENRHVFCFFLIFKLFLLL